MKHSIESMSELKSLLDAIGWERIRPIIPLLIRILLAVQSFFQTRDNSSIDFLIRATH